MKSVLHIYTDGGYNKIIDKSYYGFIIYIDNGSTVDILNVKTKKAKGLTKFEQDALHLALDYLTKSNLSTLLNVKVVIHTEIFKLLMSDGNEIKTKYEEFLGKKNVSFEYSPAHKLDLFNNLIDTLISDNNTQSLIKDFVSMGTACISNTVKTYIEMDQKGIINMFLLLNKNRLETIMVTDSVKKPKFEAAALTYKEFFINKTITYKGKKFIY